MVNIWDDLQLSKSWSNVCHPINLPYLRALRLLPRAAEGRAVRAVPLATVRLMGENRGFLLKWLERIPLV